jgi:dihydrofolate synthase/folylpolyglutamate synthase
MPPETLVAHARAIGADLRRVGREFAYARNADGWAYRGVSAAWPDLPLPAMPGAYQLRNAAGALAVLEAVEDRLPVDAAAVRGGLAAARVAGRFQRIAGAPEVILDVAHNPEAARALASVLREAGVAGRTLAVVGMLADKDAAGVVRALAGEVDAWWTCTPASSRALAAVALAEVVKREDAGTPVSVAGDVPSALAAARGAAIEGDRIVVFGSFYTVAAALDHAATQQ